MSQASAADVGILLLAARARLVRRYGQEAQRLTDARARDPQGIGPGTNRLFVELGWLLLTAGLCGALADDAPTLERQHFDARLDRLLERVERAIADLDASPGVRREFEAVIASVELLGTPAEAT